MNCESAATSSVVSGYLLGDLTDAEVEAFERHYWECDRCLAQIEEEEDDLVTRYVLGDVDRELRDKLEAKFFPGSGRQQQLTAKRAMINELREALRQGTTGSYPLKQASTEPGLAPARRSKAWQIAAMVAIAVLGAGTLLLGLHLSRVRGQLRGAGERIAILERSVAAVAEHTPSRESLTLVQTLAYAGTNAPFVQMTPAIRSQNSGTTTVRFTSETPLIIFYLEYEAADRTQVYALTLRRAGDGAAAGAKPVWQTYEVRPADAHAFVVTFSSTLLEAGEYVWELASRRNGNPSPLANYRFRVEPPTASRQDRPK